MLELKDVYDLAGVPFVAQHTKTETDTIRSDAQKLKQILLDYPAHVNTEPSRIIDIFMYAAEVQYDISEPPEVTRSINTSLHAPQTLTSRLKEGREKGEKDSELETIELMEKMYVDDPLIDVRVPFGTKLQPNEEKRRRRLAAQKCFIWVACNEFSKANYPHPVLSETIYDSNTIAGYKKSAKEYFHSVGDHSLAENLSSWITEIQSLFGWFTDYTLDFDKTDTI